MSQIVPGGKRGTGFGWYHLTVGILSLVASVLFDALWEGIDSRVAFLAAAGLATVATLALVVAVSRARPA